MDWVRAAANVESVAGFRNDLAAHLQPGGIVCSTPDFFIMLRPVPRSAPMDELLNPFYRWNAEQCDCWYIWLLAGDGRKALDLLVPMYGAKKWVAFQTRGQPKFWTFQKLHSQYGKRRRQLTSNQDSATNAEGQQAIVHAA